MIIRNITHHHRVPNFVQLLHPPYLRTVEKFFLIFWSILGIPGNILGIITWTSPDLRKFSSGRYLVALSAVDLLFFVANCQLRSVVTLGYNLIDSIDSLCKISATLYIFCQYASSALILCFTFERFLCFVAPLAPRRNAKAARLTILLVLCLCALLSIPNLFIYGSISIKRRNSTHITHMCTSRVGKGFEPYKRNFTIVVQVLMNMAVPLAIICLNGAVFSMGKLLYPQNQLFSKLNRSLAITSFFFVVCVLPYSVLSIWSQAEIPSRLSKTATSREVMMRFITLHKTQMIYFYAVYCSHFALKFYILLMSNGHIWSILVEQSSKMVHDCFYFVTGRRNLRYTKRPGENSRFISQTP